ncbi:sensor histidine kinase [Parachitinimonas caeni]|uniref:Histidine kinase n=1 Tax=Parachitinimonas caeni TaxID=3031301 RepID=A0ABT7DST8_9NEIS|nr:histidine kinase [Parachitinimonas caeni]MDK2123029.1 histidine kinase [Parachitinimonas caeni]
MTNPSSADIAARIEQPLPTEVSAHSAGWFSRSRSYPIFSLQWFRYRTLALGLMVTILCGMMLMSMLVGSDAPALRIVKATLNVFLRGWFLILLGPGLAVWVRRQGWPEKKERTALIAAIFLGLAAAFGLGKLTGHLLHPGANEPKYRLTAATIIKDAEPGSTSATRPSEQNVRPATGEQPDDGGSTLPYYFGQIIEWFMRFWLGSVFQLLMFFRQQRQLKEVLQKQALAKAEAERNQAELKLSVLAAQIEPHFLFNTLAGVRSAIASDPQRAIVIVDHLVDYLRATIPKLRSDGGSSQGRLAAQLEAAKAYLGLMRARIPRLSFEIDAAPDLQTASLPPLTLISLVENAVKHGIEPKVGQGFIRVQARRLQTEQGEQLEVSVHDDGVGFGGSSSGTGIGLANIRERLAALYGCTGGLTLKARPEGGVAAIITVPLRF